MGSLRHRNTILSNRINNIVDLNIDMVQSKLLIDLFLKGLLKNERKLIIIFFKLIQKQNLRDYFFRLS
jgi:hypothetical protein